MLKKGQIFYSWSPPYFVKWREVLLSPVKMILCSKLPCLGWRSAYFLQGFIPLWINYLSSGVKTLVSTLNHIILFLLPNIVFVDFYHFCPKSPPLSAKKLVFSKKPMLWSKFCIIPIALFWVKKRQFFRQIFQQKYLKNHNIGPRSFSL
jgi:hypothetical protein